jgi:hypothetical protein
MKDDRVTKLDGFRHLEYFFNLGPFFKLAYSTSTTYSQTYVVMHLICQSKGRATFWAIFSRKKASGHCLSAWHSGHRARLSTKRSWVRILPGYKI